MSFLSTARKITDPRVRFAQLLRQFQQFQQAQFASDDTGLPPELARLSQSILTWYDAGLTGGQKTPAGTTNKFAFLPYEPDGEHLTLWLPCYNTGRRADDRSGFANESRIRGSPSLVKGLEDSTGTNVSTWLNGANHWIFVKDKPTLSMFDQSIGFTFTINIYPLDLSIPIGDTSKGFRTIASKTDDSEFGWILALHPNGDLIFTVRAFNESHAVKMSGLAVNNLYSIAASFDWGGNTNSWAGILKLYVNDVLSTTSATPDPINDPTITIDLQIGRADNLNYGLFSGYIDDARYYYEKILTAGQVHNLYINKRSISSIAYGQVGIIPYWTIGPEAGVIWVPSDPPGITCPTGRHFDSTLNMCILNCAVGTHYDVATDTCVSDAPPAPAPQLDRFGIIQLYPTTTDITKKHLFTSQWDINGPYSIGDGTNELGSYTVDSHDTRTVMTPGTTEFKVDQDGIVTVSGNGVGGFRIYTRDQDAAHPELSTVSQAQKWQNVEVTVYNMKTTDDGPDYHVLRLLGRTNHFDIDPCATNGRDYACNFRDAGNSALLKELIHPVYTDDRRTSSSMFSSSFSSTGEFPLNKWVGGKLVVRNCDNNTHVDIEQWLDETNGFNGGQWRRVNHTVDNGGWGNTDSRIDDAITTSDNSGSECFDSIKSHDQIWTIPAYGCGIRLSDVRHRKLKNWSVREIDPLP